MSTVVELSSLDQWFGENHVIKDLSLEVQDGEFLSLLGPSGCGKTTVLRMIAGFDNPKEGDIQLDGESCIGVPPENRQVNTVFQAYALFPHMTINQNVAYGLKRKKWKKTQIKEAVSKALEMVGMAEYGKRFPAQLSGGQQQRVALARAVVNQPRVLLLDEPLGALDLKLRKQMQLELMNIHREIGTTFIFVTHDQEEALVMSDRIAIMRDGVIEQLATPSELYDRPTNGFVADFMGSSNIIACSDLSPDGSSAKASGLTIWLPEYSKEAITTVSNNVALVIRPERIRATKSPQGRTNEFKGRITERAFLGPMLLLVVELPFGTLTVKIPHSNEDSWFEISEEIYCGWEPQDSVVINK